MRFLRSFVIPTALALFMLAGCSSSGMRATLSESERTVTYTIVHGQTKRQAFDVLEIELAKIYVSAKAVTDVKQPDNGRLIAKAVSSSHVLARGLAGESIVEASLNYTIDIQTDDKRASVEFTIGSRVNDPGNYWSGYPQDLSWIRAEFEAVVQKMNGALKGEITSRPPPYEPPLVQDAPAGNSSPKTRK